MKFDKKWLAQKWVTYSLAACTAVLFYVLLSHFYVFISIFNEVVHFIHPVIIGLVFAYVLDPLVMLFEKYVTVNIDNPKLRHNISVILTIISVILFIVILSIAFIPQLITSFVTLIQNLGNYAENLRSFLYVINDKFNQHNFDLTSLGNAIEKTLLTFQSALPSSIPNLVTFFGSFGNRLMNLVISFILAIYFLIDKSHLIQALKRLFRLLLSESNYRRYSNFWYHCNTILIRYIACSLLDGLIIGVANMIFMSIMRYPYAALLSVLVGVTNLAPTFGPIVGGAIGAFILVLVNPWYSLVFLIFTLVLQTLDGYVVKPKLFGESLGISGVWILICIIVGGRMFGVTGILLAIPFAAISDYTYGEFFLKNLERRKKERERKSAGIILPPNANGANAETGSNGAESGQRAESDEAAQE